MPVKTYVHTEILDYVGTHTSDEGPFGISQGELAQSLGYHPCSMSRPLQTLVSERQLEAHRGLVRGGVRKQLVYRLTPDGREVLHKQARYVPMLPAELPVPPRPFMGRRDELRRLAEFSDDPESLIWVQGAPGMGKTALVAQHVWRLKRGRVPFWFTVRPGSSPRHFLEAIAHALAPLGASQLAYYAEVPRPPTGRVVASLVLRALRDHHLLGVLDDVQFGGPDLRSFLSEFFPALLIEGKSLFFMVGQEPPFMIAGESEIRRLEIGGLDRASAHELTDRQGGLADRFESVYQASLGSPLMLQLAVLNPGVEAKPSTLPDAVVAKMPSSELADLLPVALANAPLPLTFLTEFGRMSPERLDELVRIGILHPTGEGRVEILEAIRRAIVSRAGPLDLEAHRTLASYYLRSHRSDMVRERFLHLVAGEDWRSASEVLSREETKILSLGYSDALRNALNHMTLAMPLGPGRLRALRVQAELLRTHSEYSEAILLLRRASTDAGEDRRTRAECQLKIADLQIRLKQVESARATLDEARRSAPTTKRLRSMFQFYEARLVEARGDLAKARELFQTCFEQARKDRQSEVALEALARWSRQASIGGAHEVALRMVEQGLPEARASGQMELVFNLLLVRARAYQETGKPELADLEMRQIRAETEAKGHLNELIYTLSGLVAMTMEAGKWEEAGEFAREAIGLAERLGNETVLGHTLAALAAGELRQGKLGQAREHAERSVLVLSRLPVSDSLVFARSYLTEVYTALGEASLARQEYHAAVQLAASMGMQWWVDQMESEFKSKIENLRSRGSGGSASGASQLPSPAEQAEGG
ncbi:MAG: hypothetical protein L3J95_00215 [Thermoplasmata archaeon]|nr:hypothetical protein [Thermoplasmata archaeon]MCI4358845.1 hypothetical protein [Thermoplasmata archaeon]